MFRVKNNKAVPLNKRSVLEATGDLLARRIHTEMELRLKLERKGFDPEEIEQALKRAKELKWLNDEDAAICLTRELIRNGGHGRLWAAKKLQDRGICENLADKTLSSIWNEDVEVELARKTFLKITGSRPEKLTKQKAYSSMIRRGFEYNLVANLCEKFFIDSSDY